MTGPKVSIVIVVKNAVGTIQKCLNSVYNQDYRSFELIVVDGESNDGTLEILRDQDSQISYLLSEKDSGIYDAMNKSIAYCSGDYVYFLGSDDEFYDSKVLSKLFDSTPDKNTIIYGNAYYVHRAAIRFGKMNSYLLSKHNFNHQTIFYPRDVFTSYTFNDRYKLWADYILNLELYFKTNFAFEYRDVVVCRFNDQGSSGKSQDLNFEEDRKAIMNKYFPVDVLVFFKVRMVFLWLKSLLKSNGTKKN